MKILSVTEPFATLIKEKKKLIETRSFKTNYRGELYIHASRTRISKGILSNKELMFLINDKDMNFGHIICKCKLVDCVYMTEDYVNNMKINNYQEYICGEYKEGRYAWILDDIEKIEPISVKGQLGIWNYYSEFEIMELMGDIKYGWMDKDSSIHSIVDDTYSDNYILQSPEEVIKNKVGVCWDQVELERYYFKGWNIKTFFIVHYDNDKCPTHTFLTFERDNKYYWFEHSWEMFRGIYSYDSLEYLLLDVKKKFIKCELSEKCEESNLVLREYTKPKSHLSTQEFFNHCENGSCVIL